MFYLRRLTNTAYAMSILQDYDDQEQYEIPQISKYLDLRIDWAFKFVFSKKEILQKLLNDILPATITNLEYLPNEIPVMSEKNRRSTLDVICDSPEGKFIVEMQRRHTAETPADKLLFSYDYRENETHELMENGKTSFYYLELSRMKEREWEKLRKNPDRWCYLFKNISKFAAEREVPRELHGFEGVLEAARIDNLSPEDMDNYQNMLAAVKNEIRAARLYELSQAREAGKAEGKAEERATIAKALKDLDLSPDLIAQASGLSIEEVSAL